MVEVDMEDGIDIHAWLKGVARTYRREEAIRTWVIVVRRHDIDRDGSGG